MKKPKKKYKKNITYEKPNQEILRLKTIIKK